MALVIEDERLGDLVSELAHLTGQTQEAALEQAVVTELSRLRLSLPLRERLRRLRMAHPLPAPTGDHADKAFFDELSGDL